LALLSSYRIGEGNTITKLVQLKHEINILCRFNVEVADFDFGQSNDDLQYKTFFGRLREALMDTIHPNREHDDPLIEPTNSRSRPIWRRNNPNEQNEENDGD
jgi:hypothetical protein